MHQLRRRLMMTTLLCLVMGCNDRASQIAHEAAERQAQQSLEMSKLNQEVLHVTEQLHGEREQLNQGRDDLELERQRIANQRRTESALEVLAGGGGAVLVALFAMALAWALLTTVTRDDASAEALNELLLNDFASASPQNAPTPLPSPDPLLAISAESPPPAQEDL